MTRPSADQLKACAWCKAEITDANFTIDYQHRQSACLACIGDLSVGTVLIDSAELGRTDAQKLP